jgi:excisionase family DNA binding protein
MGYGHIFGVEKDRSRASCGPLTVCAGSAELSPSSHLPPPILGDPRGRALIFSTRHTGGRTVVEALPPQAQSLIDRLHAWRAARGDRLWTKISEASQVLGVSESTVRVLVKSGRIGYRRAGGSSLLSIDDVVDLAVAEIEQTYASAGSIADRRGEALARGRETQKKQRGKRSTTTSA